MIIRILILSGIVSVCFCACVYPSDLIGEWYSTSFGTLTFSNNSFTGFTSGLSSVPLTFTCYLASGSTYVSMTTYDLLSNVNVEVYLCMELQRISSIKYMYMLNSNKDTGTGIRFYSPTTSAGTVTLSEACSYTDTRSPGEYELLIRKDQINNAVSDCPQGLLSTFDVTMTTNSVTECNGTQLVGNIGQLQFQYSTCVVGVFNAGGLLQCIYSKQDGYNYVTLYNNDTNTDGSTTYMFTCLTFTKSGAALTATEFPSVCHTGQTPTTVNSPGIVYTMNDRYYTPPDTDSTDYSVVIIVCSILGAVIIIAIIGVVLYVKVLRKPRTPPTPPKIRKRRKKPSVTEYTPRVLGRSSSVEKIPEPACKMSAGEIITGVYSEKGLSSMSVDNLDAYKPQPKKEVWQLKWENDLKPTTRLSKEALESNRKAFPSMDILTQDKDTSVMELDKAFTMSTSLPESLDYHSNKSSARYGWRQLKDTGSSSAGSVNTNEVPKYTERSHASLHMPESTGKFGNTPCMPSCDSIIPQNTDTRLDPIKENPLSREHTPVSLKDNRLKRLQQNLLRSRNASVSVLTSPVCASDGTASGWRYKWETVLRPTSGQSDIKRKRRCVSPANLFQKSNLARKESKWKILKARLQNRFGRNKVNIDSSETESEKVEDNMDNEQSATDNVTPANLHIEDETNVRIKSADSRVSTRTEDERPGDSTRSVKRKKSPFKRRRDSLELLRESIDHLHSRATTPDTQLRSTTITPDLPNSTTASVSSLNDSVEDGRVSAESNNDKVKDTLDNSIDTKVLFLKPEDTGIIKDAHYDTVSIHTELFYPDEWIYNSSVGIQELWDLCTKTTASVRRKEYKQYLKYNGEEESAIRKDKRKRDRHTFRSMDEQRIDAINIK